MHRNKQIAIILSDTLRSIGLQSLLTDYFPPVEVCYFPNFEMLSSTGSDTYDYYFTDSDTLVLNADFFLPRRNKTALLIDSTEEHGALSSTNRITLRSSQETIIEQLQQLFTSDSSGNTTTENNKDLSSREVDVLQLIVKGITNKEIADKLNISLGNEREYGVGMFFFPQNEHLRAQAMKLFELVTRKEGRHHERDHLRRRYRTIAKPTNQLSKSLHLVIDHPVSLPFLRD